MTKPRAVIDTGVYISALLKPQSTPADAVQLAFRHAEILFSEECIAELRDTLARPKLHRFIDREDAAALLAAIDRQPKTEVLDAVRACRDPKDDKFLSLAVGGRADCIVSGDGDLLVLRPFRGVAILRPSEFLEQYAMLGDRHLG